MAQIFGGLTKRVFRVRIEGLINQSLSGRIARGLQDAWLYSPAALFVTINSAGGSVVEAKNISDLLKQYSAKNNIPIYCFAEDQCLGSANILLTTGVKNYANSMTLLGDFGFVWSRMWYQKFAEKHNISQEFIAAGENKIKVNPFKDMTPQAEKWLKNYYYLLQHDLKSTIIKNRTEHFVKLNLDQKSLEEKLFSEGIVQPQTAVKYGLIDGIKNFDDELNDKFSSTKIKEINKKQKFLQKFKALV